MKIDRIHHVAYRCKDAKETVLWYQKMLNMDFVLAIAENHVPSTKAPDPYMHIFMDAGNGNVLAFFELPTQPPMGRDPNTPDWVQHIAFRVKDREELLEFGRAVCRVRRPEQVLERIGTAMSETWREHGARLDGDFRTRMAAEWEEGRASMAAPRVFIGR